MPNGAANLQQNQIKMLQNQITEHPGLILSEKPAN